MVRLVREAPREASDGRRGKAGRLEKAAAGPMGRRPSGASFAAPDPVGLAVPADPVPEGRRLTGSSITR